MDTCVLYNFWAAFVLLTVSYWETYYHHLNIIFIITLIFYSSPVLFLFILLLGVCGTLFIMSLPLTFTFWNIGLFVKHTAEYASWQFSRHTQLNHRLMQQFFNKCNLDECLMFRFCLKCFREALMMILEDLVCGAVKLYCVIQKGAI